MKEQYAISTYSHEGHFCGYVAKGLSEHEARERVIALSHLWPRLRVCGYDERGDMIELYCVERGQIIKQLPYG